MQLTKDRPAAAEAENAASRPSHHFVPEFESLQRTRSPRFGRILAVLLIVMLALIVSALIVTPWVQTVYGEGRVIAFVPQERQQSIDAPVEGRIVRWHVVEGSRVKEGDLIADMSDNDPSALLRLQQERDAVAARIQAAQTREQALFDRIANIQQSMRNAMDGALSRVSMATDRIRQAEQSAEAAEATMRTAAIQIERQRKLLAKGLTSNRNVELAELDSVRGATEMDRAKAALNAARSEGLALEADRQKVENDFRSSLEDAKASLAAARVEVANGRAELQRVELRLSRQTTQTVRASRSGTIFRLLEQPGSNVMKIGDPIAALVPDSASTVVELWMKGNDVPLISEGRKVRLQFEGWPALQFSGWPSVAVGTFGGEVMLVDATDDGKGKFRILIAPDEKDQAWPSKSYLRQGVRANGWVLLNTVPVWYELWRQFNGFPPVIAAEEPGAGKGGSVNK